ncbi:MAG: cysteine hydrolase, partial [Betaproteobacteria bacterium]
MNACELLIIDPQNDFLDIDGAALPVAGADADMTRLAGWLAQHQTAVRAITATLDSHPSVGIERTSFWLQADGSDAAPFSVVTAAAVRAGQWRPRDAAR